MQLLEKKTIKQDFFRITPNHRSLPGRAHEKMNPSPEQANGVRGKKEKE
jgi:hypothetical protein